TAPEIVNNVLTPGAGPGGTVGYEASFLFPNAFRFYAFGASTIAIADGNADQELNAVGTLNVPGPVVGAGLPGLVAACGVLLALARRRRRLVVCRLFSTSDDELTSVLAFHGQHALLWAPQSCSPERYRHRWCWTAGTNLGERWPSRLVATAEEKRLSYSAIRVSHWSRRPRALDIEPQGLEGKRRVLSATRYHLHRHASEDDPWEHGADRRRRQESKTEHGDTERMPVRYQPANSDVFRGRVMHEFLQ